MSRLEEYIINESKKVEIVLQQLNPSIQEILNKECKKYIKLLKQHNLKPFYRGIYEHVNKGESYRKKVRQDRKPSGTPDNEFEMFNRWLSKNKHTRRDKSVSVTSSLWNAETFGNGYYFFPIGKFNYTWIKAKDLNLDDERTGWEWSFMNYIFDYEEDYSTEVGKNLVRKVKKVFPTYFTTNKGIEIAWKNSYEIWFDCKSYYVVNAE